LTTARTPAHQQWQQCHCHEGNNCNCNNGKDACALTATVQSQQGNNASLKTSNKGNNASSTTAETPAHQQQQQHHHDKSNNPHCNNGEDACTLRAATPS
jgi:hypothetical protein